MLRNMARPSSARHMVCVCVCEILIIILNSHDSLPLSPSPSHSVCVCVCLDLKNLDMIGGGFLLNKPYVYSSNIPSSLSSSLPQMQSVLDGSFVTRVRVAVLQIIGNCKPHINMGIFSHS